MLEGLKKFWHKNFGIRGNDSNPPPPSYGMSSSNNYSSTMLRNGNDFNRLYQLLRIAMDFFTSGQRVEALPFIEQILSSPVIEPVARLTAACLAAETYRGLGKFDKAEHYYELSIAESEKLRPDQQTNNEFVQHYRPRAHLGLLTVYRRILHEDHSKIQELLKQVQHDFTRFNVPDLQGQVCLVEGLYLRQIGEIENAVDKINEGYEAIKDMAPPFLFLYPEHFEALQVLTHLCQSDGRIYASRLANKLYKGGRSSWSVAVAAISLLHLHFRRAADGQFSDFSASEFGDAHEKVADFMSRLSKNAKFEKDPFLISEWNMMECIWKMLTEEDHQNVIKEVDEVLGVLKDASEPLILLRAVEFGALRKELALCGALEHVKASGIFETGLQLLDSLKPALSAYGCDASFFQQVTQYLTGNKPSNPYILEEWSTETLQILRSRVWP